MWLKKFEMGAVHNLRQSSTSILRKVGIGDDGVEGRFLRGCLWLQSVFVVLVSCLSIKSLIVVVNESCLLKCGRMDHAQLHLTNLP